MANFVSYANATELFTEVGNKFRAVNGAYILRGSITFANLPTVLTAAMRGYVYNVTEEFTTTALFIGGAGKKYPAGTNVAVADVGTDTFSEVTPEGTENPQEEGWYEESSGTYILTSDITVDSSKTYYQAVHTPDYKFDIFAGFIDVDTINGRIDNVSGMVTDREFDDTETYAIGDIVKHSDSLYRFKEAHAAGAWDTTEVDKINILDLVEDAEPDSLTEAQINALVALLD